MADPLNVTCPVCKAGPRRTCIDVTGAPHPPGHVERHETTPTADAVLAEVADDRPMSERLRAVHATLQAAITEVAAMVRAEERAHPPTVERVDRYNVVVGGVTVRATPDQEDRIRAMDADAQARFVTIMGGRR